MKDYLLTKKNKAAMQKYYDIYKDSMLFNLWNAYADYADNKIYAFNQCQDVLKDLQGSSGRIITFNKFQFTYGFTTASQFIVITKNYNYVIDLNRLN